MNHFDRISILIIPTNYCNLSCRYCFHDPYVSDHDKNGYIQKDTLSRLFDIVLPNYKHVNFVWHGGEPLAIGLDFYKFVIESQNKYKNVIVKNSIQTNLTLINNEMIDFFNIYQFGIGSSFDGVKNHLSRYNTDLFLNKLELVKSRGINIGVIQVVSGINVDDLLENYFYFKKHSINYNINPYIKNHEVDDSDLDLDSDKYVKNVIELFDFWLFDKDCNIDLKYFYKYIDFILYKEKSICTTNSCLGKWIAIKPNGNIMPCNRYFPEEYCYGNVYDYENINECFNSNGFYKLLSQAVTRREKCLDCSIYDYCSGGCNNIALIDGNIENNGGQICKTTLAIYEHIENTLHSVIESGWDVFDVVNPMVLKRYSKSDYNKSQ